jgi:hypothetical protein
MKKRKGYFLQQFDKHSKLPTQQQGLQPPARQVPDGHSREPKLQLAHLE